MKPFDEVFALHELKGQMTCVAWGLELLMKLNGHVPLGDYPLQEGHRPTSWGFGPTDLAELKTDFGLATRSWHEPENLGGLRSKMIADRATGRYSITTIPSGFFLNVETMAVDVAAHVFVGEVVGNEVNFLSKRWDNQHQLRLTFQQMDKVHFHWNILMQFYEIAKKPEIRGYLLNTLTSPPEETDMSGTSPIAQSAVSKKQ